MAKVVGDISVRVGADVSPLQQQLGRGKKSMKGFEKSSADMAKNVAKAGAVVVTAMAAIAGGILKMASEAAAAGVEIRNLSAVANTSTTTFQRMADASRTVGIEQEKLADILKDVNDKVGDFIVTGGGPMADFFENIAPKVGVTADQFARLSGPEALQLYVSSLEKAGVNQQQMTFYMEALASDATALIPLLRDNGREMSRLGDEAEKAGRVLSDEMIENAVELDKELDDLSHTLKTSATAAVLEYKEELSAVVDFISQKLIPALGSIFDAAVGFSQDIGIMVTALEKFLGLTGQLSDQKFGPNVDPDKFAANLTAAGREALGYAPLAPEDDPRFVGPMQPETGPLALNMFGGGGGNKPPNDDDDDDDDGPSRTVKSLGLTDEDFEELQERFEQERELIASAQEEQLAELQAFKDAGIGQEEEYNDLEKRIKERHNKDMAALDRAAMQQKLAAYGGMFGDLSSLMQSENDKLFKIGKAAAIAEAIVKGISGAVKAYDYGLQVSGGNPVVGGVFAAASVAKTASMISQLQSASPSGGGGASSGGGAAPSIPSSASSGPSGGGSPEQQAGTTFSFTLQNDPMGFGESFARQMIEQLNDTQANGGQIRAVLNT